MKCKSVAGYQAFPQEGALARNANLQLDELQAKLVADRGTVYCYVIATIEEQKGRLVQTGSRQFMDRMARQFVLTHGGVEEEHDAE